LQNSARQLWAFSDLERERQASEDQSKCKIQHGNYGHFLTWKEKDKHLKIKVE